MDDSPPVSHVAALLEGFARLDERLARIEQRLDKLEQLERAAPAFVAMAMDSVDDKARALQARGIDLEERLQNALTTLERLTSSETTQLLGRMLDLAEQAPNGIAMLTDTLDQHLGSLHERGIDLEERLRILAQVTERLTTPEALAIVHTLIDHLPNLDRLLGSGLLGEGPVDIVSRAGQALNQAHQDPASRVGAFGLFRALSDPCMQRSLGFALSFARYFGRGMEGGCPQPVPQLARDNH